MCYTCNLHSTSHLTIGCHWRPPHKRSKKTGKTIPEHRTMQTWFLHKIPVCNSTHDIDVTNMFNNRGNSHRYHKHKGFPCKLRQLKMRNHRRKSKPRSSSHCGEVDNAHAKSNDITYGNANDHRNKFDEPFTKGKHDDGRDK